MNQGNLTTPADPSQTAMQPLCGPAGDKGSGVTLPAGKDKSKPVDNIQMKVIEEVTHDKGKDLGGAHDGNKKQLLDPAEREARIKRQKTKF